MTSYNSMEHFIYEGLEFFPLKKDSLSTPSSCEDVLSESDSTLSKHETGSLKTQNNKFNSSQYL